MKPKTFNIITRAGNARLDKQAVQRILSGPIEEDRGGNNSSLVVCASNESRFVQSTYNQPLTAYSVGWRDPENLDVLLEEVSPSCPVPRRFSFKKSVNAQMWLSETDDIRAIGAPFKRVTFDGTEAEAKTHNRGLTMRVDQDEQVGDWQERYTGYLLARSTRNDLRSAVALISGAAQNAAVTWDSTANPDSDVRAMLRRGKLGKTGGGAYDGSGLRATRLLFGGEAWEIRQDSYEADANNSARFMRAEKTPEELQRYFRVAMLRIHEEIYQSAANAKSEIMGNIVLGYNASPGQMKDDPSNIKRFVSATRQGGLIAVHFEDHETYADITVQRYSNNVITSDLGIEQLTVSAS